MGRPTLKIPGEKGKERNGERVEVSLPCKAWENVDDNAVGHIEGHSPVRFTSPCDEDDDDGPISGR